MIHRRSIPLLQLLVVLLVALLISGLLPVVTVQAQTGPIYSEYNVDLNLRSDGALDVQIIQRVLFDADYSSAFLEIFTDRLGSINNVEVYVATEDRNLTTLTADNMTRVQASISNTGHSLTLDWKYPTTAAGEVRIFLIRYTVTDALWVYPDHDFLRWAAINADRSGVPVMLTRVTVTLPPTIAANEVTFAVADAAGQAALDGEQVVFTRSEMLPDGQPFEVEVGWPHGRLPAQVQPWQKQADATDLRMHIANLDTDLTIQPNGDLLVQEHLQVAVDGGVLYGGSRTLRALYMDSLSDIAVAHNGASLSAGNANCSDCYSYDWEAGWPNWAAYSRVTGRVEVDEERVDKYTIKWSVDAVPAGQQTSFDVSYRVVGAVRVATDDQLISWDVLPDYQIPIERASVRVHLPAGVDPQSVRFESSAQQTSPETVADGAILLRNLELPATRSRWQLAIHLPASATAATKPTWQTQFETAVADGEAAAVAQARQTLALRVGGGLTGVGALAAAVVWWFKRGRRRVRESLKGYVSEPPSSLAPGIVAYLVDRTASERAVLASLFHLASAGVIQLDLSNGIQLRRTIDAPLTAGALPVAVKETKVPLDNHLLKLFNEVVLPGTALNQNTPLDALAGRLRAALPEIYAQMGVDAQSYFLAPPTVRSGCLSSCVSVPVMMLVWFVCAVFLMQSGFNSGVLGLMLAVGTLLLFLFLAQRMARPFSQRRSATGEIEAARWIRFKNYLLNLKQYGDLGAAQEILERYFAYAVALGAETVVLADVESMGGAIPHWMPTSSWPRPAGSHPFDMNAPGGQPQPALAGAPGPSTSSAAPRPSLSGMSSALGSSLSTASSSLGRTLTTAAGDANAVSRTVTLKSALRSREMSWEAGTTPTKMLDDIMRQAIGDANTIRTRPANPTSGSSGGWMSGNNWKSSGSGRSSWGSSSSGSSWGSSRSSGSFSGGSSRSSSSGGFRSGGSSGGGRSGFGR